MALVNTSKPTTSFANLTKINIGLVWSADLLAWSAETRTWGDTASVIDNITKVTSTLSNISKPA